MNPRSGSHTLDDLVDIYFEVYVMDPTEINLFGIAHLKVDFIRLQKMFISSLGWFI